MRGLSRRRMKTHGCSPDTRGSLQPRGVATIIVRLADAKIVAWSMYPAELLTNIPPKRNVE
jgi:hypothetical protein